MNRSIDFSSEDLDFVCKDHPFLRPDFFCLGTNCQFMLLCHECTLQNLDHAKEHVNFLRPLESLWGIIRKNFLKKDPVQEKTFLNQCSQSHQILEAILEKNFQILEKKIMDLIFTVKQETKQKIHDLFKTLKTKEEKPLFTQPKDFLFFLNDKNSTIDHKKEVIGNILEKNSKGIKEETYKSQILVYISKKTSEISENLTNLLKPNSFLKGFQSDLSELSSLFDFSDIPIKESLLNQTQTDRIEVISSENPVDLTNFDTIPTFAQRYHKPNSLDNNTLDVFGKVTLIQTIDCGHNRQDKNNEGVIISQVSLVEVDNKPKIITCSKDKTIRVFDLVSFKVEKVLIGHSDWVYRFVVFQEKNVLVSGGIDKNLRIWDLKSREWKCTKTVNCESSIISLVKLDDERLAFSMRVHGLKIVDLQLNVLSYYKFHQDKEIWCILPLERSGNSYIFVGLADGSIGVLQYQKNINILSLLNLFKECHTSLIFDMISYGKEEKDFLITCSGDGMIKIWGISVGVVDWKLVVEKSFKAHEGFIRKILIYREDLLVSCSDDSNLKFWRLPDCKIVQIVKKAHGLALYWVEKINDEIILTAGEDNLSLVKFWQ